MRGCALSIRGDQSGDERDFEKIVGLSEPDKRGYPMKKHYFMAFLLSLFFLFALPVQGMAVAGGHGGGSTRGGGSGSGSGGITTFDDYSNRYSRDSWGRRGYGYYSPYGSTGIDDYVLIGASVGGVAILSLVKRKKDQRVRMNDLFAQIPGKKNEKKKLLHEIQKSFFAIQTAWEQETLEKASSYYTEKLLVEHHQVLQQNKEAGIKNHTKKIILQQVENYRQLREDSFSIRIDFSCYDYVEDQISKQVLSGHKHRKQYFSQLWYFNYSEKEGKWQVDFIQPIDLNETRAGSL